MPNLAQGFTLPEVMLALTFGSAITLAAAKALPVLRQQSTDTLLYYQLDLVLRQVLFSIEKDLRRAGFCAGECRGKAIQISNAEGEAPGSCVIIAYDFNRNGRWDNGNNEADYFGYRLRQGALEGQRGVTQCTGAGWERLVDQDQVQITTFSINHSKVSNEKSLAFIVLQGHSRERIQQRLAWVVSMEAAE
jgi:prepilin peptidase dependent protein B